MQKKSNFYYWVLLYYSFFFVHFQFALKNNFLLYDIIDITDLGRFSLFIFNLFVFYNLIE
jgi:hypothetical protein